MAEIEVCSYCVTERLILMHHLSTMLIGFLARVQALDPLSPSLSLSLSLSQLAITIITAARKHHWLASKNLDLLVCVCICTCLYSQNPLYASWYEDMLRMV